MSSGRLQRLVRGLGLGYLHTFLTVFVGLWLTPYLLQRLDPHNYGLWLLGTQVVFYLGLLDLGVVALIPREVAGASGLPDDERREALQRLIGHTARLLLWQLVPVALAGCLAMWLLPSEWALLRGPLGVVVVVFVVLFPSRLLTAVLQGLQDLAFVGAIQLVSWILGTVATIAGVAWGLGLYSMALGWVTSQTVSLVMASTRLVRTFPRLLPRRLPPLTSDVVRAQLGRGIWISVAQVAQVLLQGTDLVIVGKLLGPQAVVTYACTGKLITLLANQPQMFMQLALPALSELRASATRARLLEISGSMTQVMLLGSGAIATVVLAINEPFVKWWVGNMQFGGVGLTALFLASMLVRHLNVTAVYALFCFGHERRLAVTSIAEGAVGVAAMIILVPMWGLYGAAVGPLVATCVVSLPSNLVALAREQGTSPLAMVMPLRFWAARMIAMVAGIALLISLWQVTGPAYLALLAVGMASAYLAIMLPLLSTPPLGPVIQSRMRPWVDALMRRPLVRKVSLNMSR